MIASLRGRVASVQPDGAVVEVSGIGLFVSCAPGTLAKLRVGEPGWLATSLVVREDSLTLYGFGTEDERAIFELLQTASGVGPRLAQAVLGVHSPAAVRRAVATEDLAALTLVPGIGRKGAQRMVLELKDRLTGEPVSAEPAVDGAPWREQLRGALVGLGWSAREADEAIGAVTPEAETPDVPDVGALLRSALRLLSRR